MLWVPQPTRVPIVREQTNKQTNKQTKPIGYKALTCFCSHEGQKPGPFADDYALGLRPRPNTPGTHWVRKAPAVPACFALLRGRIAYKTDQCQSPSFADASEVSGGPEAYPQPTCSPRPLQTMLIQHCQVLASRLRRSQRVRSICISAASSIRCAGRCGREGESVHCTNKCMLEDHLRGHCYRRGVAPRPQPDRASGSNDRDLRRDCQTTRRRCESTTVRP